MNHYIIKIEGRRPSSFLSLLIILKIPFIKKNETKDSLIIEIEEDQFQRVKKLSPTYEITIIKRTGMSYLLNLYKTKKIFLFSILFAFLVITVLTNITFSIRIVETDSAVKEMLLDDLKENGIIKSRRSGKEVYYTLDDEHVSEVFEVALEHINHKKGELNEKI